MTEQEIKDKEEIKEGTICVTCKKPATKYLKTVSLFRESSCGEEDCEEEAKAKAIKKEEEYKNRKTIEIDCPPGNPRPGDLIEEVIKGTGLELRKVSGTFMGNWTYDYSDIDSEIWKEAGKIIGPRIKALYASGKIRYGSW